MPFRWFPAIRPLGTVFQPVSSRWIIIPSFPTAHALQELGVQLDPITCTSFRAFPSTEAGEVSRAQAKPFQRSMRPVDPTAKPSVVPSIQMELTVAPAGIEDGIAPQIVPSHLMITGFRAAVAPPAIAKDGETAKTVWRVASIGTPALTGVQLVPSQ